MNRCKICTEYLISEDANYCSNHCRKLDARLFFSKYSLIFTSFTLLIFILIAISLQIESIISAMVVSGLILLVLLPLYQYYHALLIEQKMKTTYKQARQTGIDEQDGHPVYIYLYINRHTEKLVRDEDYSEFI